jgi:cysteine desulfurase family protein
MNDSIYFDHASTSGSKPDEVLQEITAYLRGIGTSPGRGGYRLEQRAYHLISDVRAQLADMVGAKQKEQIAFTYNATHAINIVLKGLLKEGDHVIISSFEHNAVYRPLYKLSKEKGVIYDVWECDSLGQFNREDLKKLIRPNTRLIALNHASNVLGVLSPVEETGRLAKSLNIPLLVDVSQTAGLFPVSFGDFADYIAGTGHKSLLGPSGIGYFYARDSESLHTLYEGGSGINSLSPYHPEKIPDKFEAGTINYLGIAGLKGSLSYLKAYSQERMRNELMQLTEYTLKQLKEIPGINIYGPKSVDRKVPLLSMNLEGYFANETAHFLHQAGFCVRAGLQCAPLVHRALGTLPQGTVRISLGHTNTLDEIDQLCNTLKNIRKQNV